MRVNVNDLKAKDRDALRAYLQSLVIKESKGKIEQLVFECKVPKATFQNWRSGRARIPELAKDKIEEVAGVKIFDRQY